MKAALSSAAERDVKRALDYYLKEAGTKVAEDFINQLEATVERIRQNPEAYRVVKGLRCANLDRFPYQIVYRIVSNALVRVTSVRHHKRHPDFGLDR
jgi:plasmid stabilization system protein ParE